MKAMYFVGCSLIPLFPLEDDTSEDHVGMCRLTSVCAFEFGI